MAAEAAKVLAVAGEALDTMVHAIGEHHSAIGIKGDACHAVELPLAAAGLTPVRDEGAVRVEHRYAVQEVVGSEDIVVAVQRNRARPDELPVSTSVGAELSEKLVVKGDPADALSQLLRAPVDDVDDSVASQGHVLGSPETLARHSIHAQAVAVVEHPASCHSR